jgi:hypothetical protein
MNSKSNTGKKPGLTRRAFWDTDLNSLNFDQYKEFAITRVMERGTEMDIEEITRYYGKETIIHTLTAADRLMPRAMAAAKRKFHLTDKDFTCSTHKLPARNYSKF